MKDAQKANNVFRAYEVLVRRITGNTFVKAPGIAPFSKSWQSAIHVYDGCKLRNMHLLEYFAFSNLHFNKEWIRKQFKRDYIPLTIAVSENSRNWVFKNWSGVVESGSLADRRTFYSEILKDYPVSVVSEIVASTEA